MQRQRKRSRIVPLLVVSVFGWFTGLTAADQFTLRTSGITATSLDGAGQGSLTAYQRRTCIGNVNCVTGFAYDGILAGRYDPGPRTDMSRARTMDFLSWPRRAMESFPWLLTVPRSVVRSGSDRM